MIYLDNAATSFPKAPQVAASVYACLSEPYGNSGRASHILACKSSELIFNTRDMLGSLLGISHSENIVFTYNATMALNTAILGFVPDGGVVAVSSLEHNSVIRPLRYLEKKRNVKILIIKCDADGNPDVSSLKEVLAAKPCLIVMTMASNVTGAVLPFLDIIAAAKKQGIKVGLDGSQFIGHAAFDFDASGADFLAFSGHKGLLAPTGIGALCLKSDFNPDPLVFGGTGSLSDKEYHPDFMPDKYEAGTPNIVGLKGLLSAAEFIKEKSLSVIEDEEQIITSYLIDGLKTIPKIKIYNLDLHKKRMPVVSISVDDMPSSSLARELDARNIAVRQGLHCSPLAHKSIGTFDEGGTVRFSPSLFTTNAEIDETIKILKDII
ncbi:MAG: aminotransferase class V-fold PLP-dependent enzyme [Alphaproteobacteria bacterium]